MEETETEPASVNGSIAVHNTRALPAPRDMQHVDARRHAAHTLSEAALVRLGARRYEASVPRHPSFYPLAFLPWACACIGQHAWGQRQDECCTRARPSILCACCVEASTQTQRPGCKGGTKVCPAPFCHACSAHGPFSQLRALSAYMHTHILSCS